MRHSEALTFIHTADLSFDILEMSLFCGFEKSGNSNIVDVSEFLLLYRFDDPAGLENIQAYNIIYPSKIDIEGCG